MKREYWKQEKTIQEMHLRANFSKHDREAIKNESKNAYRLIINYTQTTQSKSEENNINTCINYTNDLMNSRKVLL